MPVKANCKSKTMKHTYHIHGMSCTGCRDHVREALESVAGVRAVTVDLDAGLAEIRMDSHIDLGEFQKALEGSRYSIHMPEGHTGDHKGHVHGHRHGEKATGEDTAGSGSNRESGNGTYYCPMQCEGDKTYDAPGDCPICGMDLVPAEPDTNKEEKVYRRLLRKFWVALGFTLPIFLIAMSEMVPGNPIYGWMDRTYWNWIQLALSLPVVFYATWMFFTRAYRSVRYWNLNMFTLIGIGAGIAWLFSVFGLLFPGFFPAQFKTETGEVHVYFEAATVILTLVLLGQVLEARAHRKTNSAVRELLKLAPGNAVRVRDGKEEEIPVEEIEIGDILRVKPGEKIPVDGTLTEGETTVDESMITGEPIPVDKAEGDSLRSGTLNGNRSFLMEAEKIGSDTLLSQIIRLVNEASRSRAPIQHVADRVSAYFVPAVVVISVITFAVWAIWGPEPAYVYGLVNGIAVLIIACPCALGLATPMSVMVGVGKGAQNGVLIREAAALETLAKVDTLIVDKTGTLTEGRPSVEAVEGISDGVSGEEVLELVASLNRHSEHPLARAMVAHAEQQGVSLRQPEQFESLTGKGVAGRVGEQSLALGNAGLMKEHGAEIPSALEEKARAYQDQGKTVSYLAADGEVIGLVALGDRIKEGTRAAIDELRKGGMTVHMLTGDNERTAGAVAGELGISEFRAGMLPEDKLSEVERLKRDGKVVAMAGDGINDAPALAKSDVGIAMGTGTDVAIESAGVTLVDGDLSGIVKARKLSKKVMRNIRENLFFALVYNTIGVPVAAGVLFPFFGILLSPMIAAAAMSFSSVSVIANALRLRAARIN